ncbi:MAG: helix-turn-helix domain-containing protein [Alphaproteobacteria bacterium]
MKADQKKLPVPSDEEIARQISDDPDTAPFVTNDMLIAPQNLRRRLNLTQEAFAAALGIPVATLRNWEQGRNAIDPAARALLLLVARDPEGTLAVLAAARADNGSRALPRMATGRRRPSPQGRSSPGSSLRWL